MPLPAIFRTSIFRLTILYVVLFGVSAAGLGAFIYVTTVGYVESQTEETIETEINALRDESVRAGSLNAALDRLVLLINARTKRPQQPGDELFSYMLVDQNSRRLAGNLREWPAPPDVVNEWRDFEFTSIDGERVPVRARILSITINAGEQTGLRLLVGREIREISAVNQRFVRALSLGLGLTLLVALAGGLALAISAQRHVTNQPLTARGWILRRIS